MEFFVHLMERDFYLPYVQQQRCLLEMHYELIAYHQYNLHLNIYEFIRLKHLICLDKAIFHYYICIFETNRIRITCSTNGNKHLFRTNRFVIYYINSYLLIGNMYLVFIK